MPMATAALPREPPRRLRPLRPVASRQPLAPWPRLQAAPFAALLAFAVVAAPPAPAQPLQAHLAVSSDYVVHGVSRSQGDPTLQAQVGADLGAGWSAGLSAATMNLNPGRGPNRELGVYLSRARSLDRDWTIAGTLAAYFYSAQIRGLPYDYHEAHLELSWRERVQLGIAISPDYSVGTRRGVARDSTALDYTLTVSQPLSQSVAVSAGIGQYDLSDGLGLRFTYWSAGAVYTGRRLSLALTWTDAEPITRTMFSAAATGERLIATISWRLH